MIMRMPQDWNGSHIRSVSYTHLDVYKRQDDKADKAGDPDTADTDSSEKSTALKLKIPYRYSKGLYSLHTGIDTTNGNEAAL